jgi:hypothetical protein
MDAAEDKKWFIYVGDHHEGPFSLNDLRGKMSQGVISTSSYVWAEGMPDWQLLTEIHQLSSLTGGGPQAPPAGAAQALALEVPQLQDSIEPIAPPVADPNSGSMAQPMSVSLAESVQEPSSPRSSYTANSEVVHGSESLASSVALASSISTGSGSLADKNYPELKYHDPLKVARQQAKAHKKSLGKKKRFINYAALILLVGGLGYGYGQGYFDGFLKSNTVAKIRSKAGDYVEPYLLKLAEKVPPLAKWISPIPQLPDVAPEDYEELRQASIATPQGPGTKWGLAISKTSVVAPFFYVTGNLPEGTHLKIIVDGVPDQLIGKIAFNQTLSAIIEKKLARTQPLHAPDGSSLPRGQYLVTLIEAPENAPDTKAAIERIAPPARPGARPGTITPLVSKSFFLGGLKDPTYAQQLKTFHEQLSRKASDELVEAKSYLDTFEGQLTETNQKFGTVKFPKPAASKKKAWELFSAKWKKFWGQMDGEMAKWTPDNLRNDRYYSGLYQMLLSAAQAIEKAHGLQTTFVSGQGDRKSLEIQIGEAQSAASTAITTLRAHIEQIDKIPTPPGGMPVREEQLADFSQKRGST